MFANAAGRRFVSAAWLSLLNLGKGLACGEIEFQSAFVCVSTTMGSRKIRPVSGAVLARSQGYFLTPGKRGNR